MEIIGDRHFKREPGETVTLAVGKTVKVGRVVTPDGPLPFEVPAHGHARVTVTVGFTDSTGGSAVITVTGSAGGEGRSTVKQLPGLPVRNAFFTFDEEE
jgi:hypothetical protein